MFFLPSNATIPAPGNGTSQKTNPLGAVKQVGRRGVITRGRILRRLKKISALKNHIFFLSPPLSNPKR